MSAEILRRAAALMRERAEAASPGPWDVQPDDEGRPRSVRANGGLGPTPFRAVSIGYDETNANVAHIVSWHPAVALAVADWLDRAAERADFYGPRYFTSPFREGTEALAAARAYLGESA